MSVENFEKLLLSGENEYTVESANDVFIDNTIQRADKSAGLTDLFDMLDKLVSLTLKDLNVEFVPEEDVHEIVIADKQIDKNYITYVVNSRQNKDGPKPRIRESVRENVPDGTGRLGNVYGKKFKSIVQFNILSSDHRQADLIMSKFEEMVEIYTGYLKRQGIAEIFFQEQIKDTDYNILRQKLSVRSIRYYVETERVTVIFKESVNQVETILSKK